MDRRQPKGSAWPRKEIVDSITPDEHTPERRVISWPYYAWNGEAEGRIVEMIPVEERTEGAMHKTTEIRIYVDGKYVSKMGADGTSAEIADYLRGGMYDCIGESLQAHERAERGETSIGPEPEMPAKLKELLSR